MNRRTLAALGLASALTVSGTALQVAPAHATITQLQSAPAVQTEAATAEVVKKNFNNPPPIKKKKKPVLHAKKQHKDNPTQPTPQ